MDPNNPGQNPGAPTPDPWGQPQQPVPPPAPGQPAWGQPPADPNQPAWGQPPVDPNQPGAQPPVWGAPAPGFDPATQQPYGQPAWGVAPAAVPAKKSPLTRIVAIIVVAVVVGGVLLFGRSLLSPSHAGEVVFTTDAPTSDGAKTCQLGHQVTSVTAGSPVYANYFFSRKLGDEVVTMTIIKDGTALPAQTWTAGEAKGVDCLEDTSDLSMLPAGVYEFKLTIPNGDVVSDGKLTVK